MRVLNKILAKRLLAYTIDITISSFIYISIYLLILPLSLFIDKSIIDNFINQRDALVDYFTIILFYYTVQEMFWHKTVGKRIVKLKIVDINYESPKFYQILIRNVFRLVDQLLVVGSITILFDGRNRRLGDMISKTMVVDGNYEKNTDFNDINIT